MPHSQNAFIVRPQTARSAQISTILPISSAMPIDCDSCDLEHNYSIGFLRSLPTMTCKHCGDQRKFTAFELNVLETTLKQMGYFLAKSA